MVTMSNQTTSGRPRRWPRRLAFSIIVLLALGAAGYVTLPYISGVSAPVSQVEIGAPVDAAMSGSDGKTHRLSEYRGKILVLEWTSPVCEFTARHYASGAMQALQKEALGQGAAWVPVSSTANGVPGFMESAAAQSLIAKRGVPLDYIALDADGVIGHMFGAHATPSVAIVDSSGKLAYLGAIDDNPWGDGSTGNNYVRAALSDLSGGKPVKTPITRAYGCGIKYAGP
jgi:AhpC/TSA family